MPQQCRAMPTADCGENEVSWEPGLGVPLSSRAGGQGRSAKTDSDFIKKKYSTTMDLLYMDFFYLFPFLFFKNTLEYLSWSLVLLGFPGICPHFPHPSPHTCHPTFLSYIVLSQGVLVAEIERGEKVPGHGLCTEHWARHFTDIISGLQL